MNGAPGLLAFVSNDVGISLGTSLYAMMGHTYAMCHQDAILLCTGGSIVYLYRQIETFACQICSSIIQTWEDSVPQEIVKGSI